VHRPVPGRSRRRRKRTRRRAFARSPRPIRGRRRAAPAASCAPARPVARRSTRKQPRTPRRARLSTAQRLHFVAKLLPADAPLAESLSLARDDVRRRLRCEFLVREAGLERHQLLLERRELAAEARAFLLD